MSSDYIPFNIKTEAGKALWIKMNQHNGSSVWGPVGEGIEQIEREAAQRERERLLAIHLEQSKKMGYSRDYIIEALKGKVWKEEE